MNNRETCSPCTLKHCGAITGALNIPAQRDAARRSLDCATPAVRAFSHYTAHLNAVNSGPGPWKTTDTKQLLELLQVSSKTQCGGLRPGEYCTVEEGWGKAGQKRMEGEETIKGKERKEKVKVETLLVKNCIIFYPLTF